MDEILHDLHIIVKINTLFISLFPLFALKISAFMMDKVRKVKKMMK